MPKIVHEYWYIYGTNQYSHYELRVERETPKMFYGRVFRSSGDVSLGNFAVNKDNLNQVIELKGIKGIEYRVQINPEDAATARNVAKELFYNHIRKIAEKIITTDLGACI